MSKPTKKELMDFRIQLGRRVAELRQQQDPPMTQWDLSLATGMRPELISRIERATNDFSVSNLLKLSEALRIDVADFFTAHEHYPDNPRAQAPAVVHDKGTKKHNKGTY